jgi:hypothetical protein
MPNFPVYLILGDSCLNLRKCMKRSNWLGIIAGVMCVAGFAPVGSIAFGHIVHNQVPLAMAVQLHRGTSASSIFSTDLSDAYSIRLNWGYQLPYSDRVARGAVVTWEILDNNEKILDAGKSIVDLHCCSGEVTLGEYKPKKGVQQKAIVTIDGELSDNVADVAMFTVGLPPSLDREAGECLGYLWAIVFCSLGVLVGLIAVFRRFWR